MKLLFKYLKKYIFLIVVVVLFTFVQVQSELKLPDYMSDIVTNGIQYNGISENVPRAISEKELDKVSLFVDDLDSIYTLAEKDREYKVANQVVSFKENVYILNEDYDGSLDNEMSKAMTYVFLAEKAGVDDDTFKMLKDNPSMKKQYLEKFDEYVSGLQDNTASVSKFYIQSVYEDIGLNVETVQSNYILHEGLLMLGVALVSICAQLSSTYLATKIATNVAYRMRRDVYNKVESFASAEFSKFSTSSLITRTTNDITQIQQLTQMCLRMMLMAPLMGITSIFKVMRYPDMLWILLVAIGVIAFCMILLLIFALPRFKKMQTLIDKLNNVMRELLDGLLVIRAFNTERNEEKRFDVSNRELYDNDWHVNRTLISIMPIMMLTMNLLTIGILWYGAKLIDIDVMSVGDMMAFIQYAMHVVMSFMILAMVWTMVPRALVSLGRVNEVLSTENTIMDKDDTVDVPSEGVLAFNDVSFKYPNAEENVLEHISFKALPGETVAFIGSTGSGKSTIVKLIPRLFDVSEGSITYGDHDIRDYSQKDLRDHIGYVTQKAILFKGTIKSNIEFGEEIDEDALNSAIDIAQAREIISEKELGVDEPITQGGTNVSGGQKQRISIARALAKRDANIFIFDDSFSALDYKTDKKLRDELSKMIEKKKSTVLIVAQRISTIKNADKIVVLDEGKIVGMGKHSELMKDCDVYKEIAYSQLSKEELEDACA
ncbi:MAG: ABC transporter ATP-binding protein [Erysipelotrichaceae bacterium]|nr:ABC transporter ATP-binding protein [Erysipelotrichaceae bacterium]